MTPSEKFASIKLSRPFVEWLKVEAAKAKMTMYEFLESRFPGVPKKLRRED